MNSPRIPRNGVVPIAAVLLTAAGCATGPLVPQRTASLDDSGGAAMTEDGEGPVQRASFLSVDVLPQWPDEEELAQTRASVAAPLSAGADAVKRGAGQVRQGVVSFGQGARRAVTSTASWLSRPLVAVRTNPGEPSLLQRMFSPEPTYDRPETVTQFLEQERVR